MVFEALVINTDTFFERGTIVVRIPKFYFRTMQWDLSEEYPNFMDDSEEDADGYTKDFEAFVYSPYGGGSNFGTFFLPQVNQRGIVMAMDNKLNKLIWLGSFFKPERNDNWEVEKVDVPTDDMNQEGENGYGVLNAEPNMVGNEKETNFIARFKTTDKSSAEGLTWEDRPTSNIISIGDNGFYVTHFSKDEGWEDHTPKLWTTYKMAKDENEKDITELKRTDINGEKEQRMALAYIDNKESFITEIKHNEKKNTILQQDDVTELTVEEDNKSGKIKLTKDGISIVNNDDGTEYSINVSSQEGSIKIDINGNSIELKENGELIVGLEEKIELKTESDVIIKPDGTVKIGSSNLSFVARYDELKKVIDKLEKHIHVAPTGPTTAPLESSMSPIPPGIMKDKRDMKSKKLQTE